MKQSGKVQMCKKPDAGFSVARENVMSRSVMGTRYPALNGLWGSHERSSGERGFIPGPDGTGYLSSSCLTGAIHFSVVKHILQEPSQDISVAVPFL